MTTRFAILVRPGEKVKATIVTGDEIEEIVRDVSVTLHLANGQDVVLKRDAEVEIILDTVTDAIKAQAESLEPIDD